MGSVQLKMQQNPFSAGAYRPRTLPGKLTSYDAHPDTIVGWGGDTTSHSQSPLTPLASRISISPPSATKSATSLHSAGHSLVEAGFQHCRQTNGWIGYTTQPHQRSIRSSSNWISILLVRAYFLFSLWLSLLYTPNKRIIVGCNYHTSDNYISDRFTAYLW